MFSETGWSQTKTAQVQIEEKTFLKRLVSSSAISAASRSSGCASGCWHDPGNFLTCCWSPSWSAEAQSIYGCTKCPASPCCAVTRGCGARPCVPERLGTQAGAESKVMGKQCRRGACSGSSLGLCLSSISSAVISKVSELYRITKMWENLTSSVPREKEALASLFH